LHGDSLKIALTVPLRRKFGRCILNPYNTWIQNPAQSFVIKNLQSLQPNTELIKRVIKKQGMSYKMYKKYISEKEKAVYYTYQGLKHFISSFPKLG